MVNIMLNKEIKDYLELLEELAVEFNIIPDKNDKYNSISRALKMFGAKDEQTGEYLYVQLSDKLTDKIREYLKSVKMREEKVLVFNMLYPGEDFSRATDEQKKLSTIDNLDSQQIFRLFKLLNTTVATVQFDNFLLLKYSPALYNTGWSGLTQNTRGKVITLDTKEIVVYPFDKFFNFNETEENTEKVIKDKIQKASNISVTEKKDGSLIILTNVDGYGNLLHTKGAVNNEHAAIATKLFRKKYPDFWNNVPKGYTFMFELISDEDPHIIKYGQEQLDLLSIRDLSDLHLFSYDELVDFAAKNKLNIVKQYEFKTLDEFLERAENGKEGIEGWVIRINVPGEPEHIFKLKTEEYKALRRLERKIPLKKVYSLLVNDRLQALLEAAGAENNEDIASTLEEIDVIKIQACEETEKLAKEFLSKYNLTLEDCAGGNIAPNNKPAFLEIIKEANQTVFAAQILRYIKYPESKYSLFERCAVPSFMKTANYFKDK